MTTVSTEQLATTFVEFADTLVAEFDLIEFLQMLTDRTAGLVGAAAVGLLLTDTDGRLQCMAASTESAKMLELFQLHKREGPCLEAFRSGRPVINVNLSHAAPRWPCFAPRAIAIGFHSVHAFPMRQRSQIIGALNVFGGTRGGDFNGADVAIVQALADVAAIALLQERAIRRGEILTEQLQNALNSRIVIEQAKGVIAQANQISVDDAFALIRTYARGRHKKITDVAHTIVTDRSAFLDIH